MRKRVWLSLLALASVVLAGCASGPQQLSPDARLTAPIAAVGQGQQVVVRVVDGRGSFALGTRGGLYPETSTITVRSQDVIPKVQAQAENAIRQLGFTPTSGGSGAPELTLTLAELKYQSPKDSMYVTAATIGATFKVDVRNSSRSYSGRYGASLDQRFGMAPNAQTNTKLVSDVLSDALTRVFKDQTIGQVLSGR